MLGNIECVDLICGADERKDDKNVIFVLVDYTPPANIVFVDGAPLGNTQSGG